MNCKFIGYDLKCLEVTLNPGEQFYGERGSLIYLEKGIERDMKVLQNGVWGMVKRGVSGESVILVEYKNTSRDPKKMVLAGYGGMLSVNLADMEGGILCKKGYYVASSQQVEVDVKISLGSLFSGLGLVLQKISGNGTVFLDSIGSPTRIDLQYGQAIQVDEGSLICTSLSLEGRIQSSMSASNIFSGEGFSLVEITGPGIVYINSVNLRTPVR
jgi:uncharacterized protein (AIM24 family)